MMWRSDQGAHVRERLTTNQFDLTLQDGPNQHGTHKPRRTTRTNHSPPRLELQDRPTIIWSAELNVRPPKVNICIPISPRLLDYPRRWDGVLYFRGEAVLDLPVSTTSYSRYAVSTVQTWSVGPTTARSLTDTGRTTPLPPGLRFYSFFHFKTFIHKLVTHIWKHKAILYLASNQELLDFYRTLSSIAFLSSYTY